VAAAVVTEFVRSPEMFQFDLLDNPAVRALAADPQHAPLHRLLTIFLSGTVKVWHAVPCRARCVLHCAALCALCGVHGCLQAAACCPAIPHSLLGCRQCGDMVGSRGRRPNSRTPF
jgi:hypothetical protein